MKLTPFSSIFFPHHRRRMYINKHTQHANNLHHHHCARYVPQSFLCDTTLHRERVKRAKNLERGKSPDVKNILHTCVVKKFFIFFSPFRLSKSSHARHHHNAISARKFFPPKMRHFRMYSKKCVYVHISSHHRASSSLVKNNCSNDLI